MAIVTCIRADLDEGQLERAILASAALMGLRPAEAGEEPHRTIAVRASRGARGWIVADEWDADTLALEIVRRLGQPALALSLDLYEERGRALVLRGGEEIEALAWDGVVRDEDTAPDIDRWIACFGAIDVDALRAAACAEDPAEWLDELARAVGIAPGPFAGASQTLGAQLGRFAESIRGFLEHATLVLGRGSAGPGDFDRPPEAADPEVTTLALCFTEELVQSVLASGPPDFAWSLGGAPIGDDAALSDEELEARYRRGEAIHEAARAFQRAMSNFGRAVAERDEEPEAVEPVVHDAASASGPWRLPVRIGQRGSVQLHATNQGGALTGVVLELGGAALSGDHLRVRTVRVNDEELTMSRPGALPVRFELPRLEVDAGLVSDRERLEPLGPWTTRFEAPSQVEIELDLEGTCDGESELDVWVAPLPAGPKRLCRVRIVVDAGT